MTGRERILAALNHEETDKLPIDFGGTMVTGIAASTVYKIRQSLGLDEPGTPVKVIDPFQMLGEVAPDLREALGIDTTGIFKSTNMFGFKNEDWKRWTMFDGTPVLVPGDFNTEPDENGDILMYPEGDKSAPPSGRMPKGGYYFDAIVRQEPFEEDELDPEDNLQEFGPIPEGEMSYLERQARDLRDSGLAVIGTFADAGFGDIAKVPATFLKYPKGIRDVEEWYISSLTRRPYVRKVFEGQCEIILENLERAAERLGDDIQILYITGTDFGTQRGPFISTDAYCDLYKPFHRRVNDWVHEHTNWKTFIHSCGGVEPLIEHFVEAGFDILNPVQCSAKDMDPDHLKKTFGDRITFWGGGIDTQKTLPFGTPDEVREQVKRRVETFAEGGGFVFNSIHNVQARTPEENVMAMFETLNQYR